MAADQSPDPATEIVALAPGTVFHGVYQVIRCIKAGGMGAVYEALHVPTQRYRALKVMLPSLVTDPEMRARFELEAKIAAGIVSDHIVETMDAGIDQTTGMPFIVMELLKGEELGKLLKDKRRLSPLEVVTYLHQAALALDRTHAAGIIHRDLKPENLFLTHRDDGSPRVKILDFGVAKIVADGSVNANSTKTVGSPLYMGPEQISGELKIGPAVDRYSLAHIAFTLLVGKPYWAVERKAADGIYPFMMQLMRGAKVPASERAAFFGVSMPAAFDVWFAKATSIDPSQRFDNAAAQIADLARVFGLEAPAGQVLPTVAGPALAALPAAALPPKEPGQTSANDRVSTVDRAAPAMVRSDEPSLQPVSVQRTSRAWVVPASLLAVGVVGIGAALILWPERPLSSASSSPAVKPLVSAQVAVAQPVASASSAPAVEPAAAMTAVPSAAPAVSTATAAVLPAKPAPTAQPTTAETSRTAPTTTVKSTPTKKNNVLDEY